MSKGVQIGNKTRAFVNFLNIQFALDIINVHESKPKKKKKKKMKYSIEGFGENIFHYTACLNSELVYIRIL